MSWVLIFIVVSVGAYERSTSASSVPGFASAAACVSAGRALASRAAVHATSVVYYCAVTKP